jgi:hypothetical protein
MNIYEDYQKYIDEYRPLIEDLTQMSSSILSVVDDIVAVLDYTLKLYLDHSKIDEDLQDAFEIGFQYLENVFSDLKVYYEDYFSSNPDRLKYYGNLITYSIFLDDYKGYLLDEEMLTDELKATIDNIQDEADKIMVNLRPYDDAITERFDTMLQEHVSSLDRFHPIPSIFNQMRELLDIM